MAAVLASAVIGMIMTGCDLLNNEVLIDDGAYITEVDSTRIRVLSYAADSTHLVINSTGEWQATLSDGEGWCTISKTEGRKGYDTIDIFVKENTTTVKRKAQIAVVSGTLTKVYWVVQSAAEEWLDVMYWDRTALQRMGLHSQVDSMKITDNWHPNNQTVYYFDIRGNVLKEKTIENDVRVALREYTYDEQNHRLTCTVKDLNGGLLRSWAYEYENKGKYVAYSAAGWFDENPLDEAMDDRIVPDLSASHKSWTEGGVEMYEDRTFTFEEEYKLVICTERWKDVAGDHVTLMRDTVRVSYQYSNGKLLPKKSRGYVDLTVYYPNGMINTMTTPNGEYKFHENLIRMAVERYNFTGSGVHDIDFIECDFNSYHDVTERRVKYSGSVDIDVHRYPQYQYDNRFNWFLRYEEASNHEKYTQRTITYF